MRIVNYRSGAKKTAPFTKLRRWFHSLPRKKILTWSFRALAAGVLLIAFLFIYFSKSLPDPNRLLGRNVPQSTKIYDRGGKLLYEIHGEVKRTLVNLDQIPTDVQNAAVAVEDKNFYQHGGISITGLIRSVIVDVLSGQKRQGGSTITQQFVKNAVLTREKSVWRKLKEIILSIEIEARFSKKDILKLYLNEIPYGRNAYGIEAAAQTYFGKSAKDLSLAESAYLAALPQAPTYYNPAGPHADALMARQRYILEQMKQQGYISNEQYKKALDEKVVFSEITNAISAPHFVLYVQDYLANKYGEQTVREGGLKVYTSLDSDLQKIAEDAVKTGIDKFSKKYNANNAGLVAIDPKTGQILAMVGSRDYFGESSPSGCVPGKNCLFEPNFNVTTSPRQPGSSFKPYVYATAFGKNFNYSPASLLIDVTTNFGSFAGKNYVPRNYNGQNYGPLSMRSALAGSLNVPAVKTLALVGVDNATQTAHNLGITSPLQNCGLSLVLGGCEVKLIDHTASFAAIANEGNRHDKTSILKVIGQDGQVLEEYQDQSQQVIGPEAAYQLINIMTDNSARSFIFGANSPLYYPDRPVACKTGTTQKWHDAWTLCFTPSIAVGVWAGNNDGTLLKAGADGVVVAAPIVNQVMNQYLKGKPVEDFAVPPGISKITVDTLSGKLPTQYSPETKTEVFADYNQPTDYDNVHVVKKIDRTTGLPATDNTLPQNIEERVCLDLRSEKPDNPNWELPVQAWLAEHGGCNPASPGQTGSLPQVRINQPSDGATITALPFAVSASVSSSNSISRVDLLIDDDNVSTLSSAPYQFSVGNLSEGQHILTIRATDNNSLSNDSSITVTVSLNNQSLSITAPNDGDTLNFPQTLTAQSPTKFDNVTFYYQIGSVTKTIGQAKPKLNPGGLYDYSLLWTKPPKPGQYKIFARSNTSISSPKISVAVP